MCCPQLCFKLWIERLGPGPVGAPCSAAAQVLLRGSSAHGGRPDERSAVASLIRLPATAWLRGVNGMYATAQAAWPAEKAKHPCQHATCSYFRHCGVRLSRWSNYVSFFLSGLVALTI